MLTLLQHGYEACVQHPLQGRLQARPQMQYYQRHHVLSNVLPQGLENESETYCPVLHGRRNAENDSAAVQQILTGAGRTTAALSASS